MRHNSKLNQGLVLRTIEKHGSVSRADVSRETKLSPPTVSKIVQRLIDKDIVIEIGRGSSLAGKRPILLTINPSSVYMIAVDLGVENGIKAALVNLSYNITKYVITPKRSKDAQLSFYLTSTIKELLKDIDFSLDKIAGICIGVPGVVDLRSRKITIAPYLDWEIRLDSLMLEEFNIPVTVENDVNLMALGERTKGIARGVNNFVFIGERVGIGAGIVTNGSLYTGYDNAAGEIGYLLINMEKTDDVGEYGPFEKLIGYKAIAEKAKKDAQFLKELDRIDPDSVKALDVFKAALKGNERALFIVKEVGNFLAYSIVNIIALVNPEMVVIGGEITLLGEKLLKGIRSTVQKMCPIGSKIEFSKLGEDGIIIGAANKVFEPLKKEGMVSLTI